MSISSPAASRCSSKQKHCTESVDNCMGIDMDISKIEVWRGRVQHTENETRDCLTNRVLGAMLHGRPTRKAKVERTWILLKYKPAFGGCTLYVATPVTALSLVFLTAGREIGNQKRVSQ